MSPVPRFGTAINKRANPIAVCDAKCNRISLMTPYGLVGTVVTTGRQEPQSDHPPSRLNSMSISSIA